MPIKAWTLWGSSFRMRSNCALASCFRPTSEYEVPSIRRACGIRGSSRRADSRAWAAPR